MGKLFAVLALTTGLLVTGALYAQETNQTEPLTVTTVTVTVTTNVKTNAAIDMQPKKFVHYVGLYAGMTTGIGITYRYFDDWGIQVSILPMSLYSSFIFDLGVTGLKTIYSGDWSKFFLFLGGDLFAGSDRSTLFSVGAGAGIEFFLSQNIAIDLMFGLGANGLGSKEMYPNIYYGITVEGGIFYRF